MYPEVSPVHGFERCADIVQSRRASWIPTASRSARRAQARDPPTLPIPWMPAASWRNPHAGSSDHFTSAINQLIVGSQPANSIPAALRIRLRPPSQPTRYSARNVWPSDSATSTPDVVLGEPCYFTPAKSRHSQFRDPTGQDALEVVLPQRQQIIVARRKVAHVQRRRGNARRCAFFPARETGQRCRADPGSRLSASAAHLRAILRGPGLHVAPQ